MKSSRNTKKSSSIFTILVFLIVVVALLVISLYGTIRKDAINLRSKAAESTPPAAVRYCQNRLTEVRCEDAINCKWFNCAYKGRGGCFSADTKKRDVCPACSNNYDITSCNKAGGCAWYGCAYNGRGGCYESGTDQDTVCPHPGCKLYNNKKDCSEKGCVWYGCSFQGKGGCFRPGASLKNVCPSCTEYTSITSCNDAPGQCAWYASCKKCAQTGTEEVYACNPNTKPTKTPTPICHYGVKSLQYDEKTACSMPDGQEGYQEARYTCYDGSEGTATISSNCELPEYFEYLGEIGCEGKSDCSK